MRRFFVLPIQICDKVQAQILRDADPNIEPEWRDSVVAIDIDRIECVQKSDEKTCSIILQSGKSYWIQMTYDDLVHALDFNSDNRIQFMKF